MQRARVACALSDKSSPPVASQVFRPSLEEWRDPLAYIRKIQAVGAQYGERGKAASRGAVW